jgi:hypothetical protein
MPLYVTVREGPSPATSVPLLVVADQRLIQALVDELVRIAGAESKEQASPTSNAPRRPRQSPFPSTYASTGVLAEEEAVTA